MLITKVDYALAYQGMPVHKFKNINNYVLCLIRQAICISVLMIILISGCATLDAKSEMKQFAEKVEHAAGSPGELLLYENETVEKETKWLLADGLTIEEAVQVALLNNPRVRSAMLSIGVSRADFVQSKLYSNPSLFLSMRFPDGGGLPNVEFNLAQNIAELWLVPAQTKTAQRDLDRVILEAARTTSNIVMDVRQSCVNVIQTEEQLKLAEQGLDITGKLVEMAELRQKAGTGSQVDVNLARTEMLQVEINVGNASLAAYQSKADLNRLLGLDTDPDQISILSPMYSTGIFDFSADELQSIARESRLDLQIMEKTVESNVKLAELERVRFFRSIDIGFSVELEDRRDRGDRNWLSETFYDSLQGGALTPPNLMPRQSQNVQTVAGPTIGLELPIWDQNQAQIARADRLVEQSRQQFDAILIDASQDIFSSLARLQTARENARIYDDEFIPTANRNVELAEEGYRIGKTPFLSLLEVQRAYLATHRGRLQTLRNVALAEIQLERVTGRPANSWRESITPNSETKGKKDAPDSEITP